MPEPIVEDQLSFDFPAPWIALKFDHTAWYRETIKTRVKAVDIVAFSGSRHWWIEVKDCLGFEPDNLPRLRPGDQPAVELARDWVESQGLQDYVAVRRTKPFIVDEVAEKLEGTLVSLAAAARAGTGQVQAAHVLPAAGVMYPQAEWSLVLLLIWNPAAKDFGRLALRLRDKLAKRLQAFNIECFVLNEAESAPQQPWRVARLGEPQRQPGQDAVPARAPTPRTGPPPWPPGAARSVAGR